MRRGLIFIVLLLSHYGMSQQGMLNITTDIQVDSVYFSGTKHDFVKVSDSVLQLKVDLDKMAEQTEVVLYSMKRIYRTDLLKENMKSVLPEKVDYILGIHLTMLKKQCSLTTFDGRSMNLIGSLRVYSAKTDKLIIKESCGVYEIKEK